MVTAMAIAMATATATATATQISMTSMTSSSTLTAEQSKQVDVEQHSEGAPTVCHTQRPDSSETHINRKGSKHVFDVFFSACLFPNPDSGRIAVD